MSVATMKRIIELHAKITDGFHGNKLIKINCETKNGLKVFCIKKGTMFMSSDPSVLKPNKYNTICNFDKTAHSVVYMPDGTCLLGERCTDELYLSIKDQNVQLDLQNCQKFGVDLDDVLTILELQEGFPTGFI